MKCKNPNCKDPSYLDKLGSLPSEFKWCPICGSAIGEDTTFNGDAKDIQATITQSTENVQASSSESAVQKISDEKAQGTTITDEKSSEKAADSATMDGKTTESTPGIAGTTTPVIGAAENNETTTEETKTPVTTTTQSKASTEATTGETTLEAATTGTVTLQAAPITETKSQAVTTAAPETITTGATASTQTTTGIPTSEGTTANGTATPTLTSEATTADGTTAPMPTLEASTSDGTTTPTPSSKAITADGTTAPTPSSEGTTANEKTTPTPSSEATTADGTKTPTPSSEATTADGTTTPTPSSEATTADGTTTPTPSSEATTADGTTTPTPSSEATTADGTTTPTPTTISEAKTTSSIKITRDATTTATTQIPKSATTISTVATTTALVVSTATKTPSTTSTRTTTKATTVKEKEKQSVQTPPDSKGNTQRNDCMTVHFHALLSPYFDFKESEGDRIIVRGQLSHAKPWHSDQVQMSPVRRTASGYVLIVGTIEIPVSLTHNKLPYKYVVVKQGDKKPKDVWEEIIGYPYSHGMHTNRCLVIPEKYRKPDATWHQYDDAIYSQPKSWKSRVFNYVTSNAPDPVEGRYLAMEMMLPNWNLFYFETTSTTLRGSEALESILQVIYCMENNMIATGNHVQRLEFADFSMEKALLDYIVPMLNFNISTQSNDENTQAHRLATSLAITAITSKIMNRYQTYLPTTFQLTTLLHCLAINASLDPKKLQRIFERLAQYYTKKNLKSRFSESILHLCQFTINQHPDIYDWLVAMPLVHFLTESCEPYSAPPPLTDPAGLHDPLYWGIHTLDLTSLDAFALAFQRSTLQFLPQVKPLFKLDPLLQRTFLLSLPLRSLGECAYIAGVPSHEICWTLARFLHDKKTQHFSKEEALSVDYCRMSMSEALEQTRGTNDGKQEPIYNEEELRSLSIALLQVIDRFLAMFNDNINFICGFLNVLAKTLTMLKTSCSSTNGDNVGKDGEKSNDEFSKKHFEETLNKVIQGLGRFFTGEIFDATSTYSNEELLVYSKLYKTEISDEVLLEVWKGGLTKHVASRFDKMDDMKKIEFYSKLDFNKFDKELESFFKDAAFDAVKNITESARRSNEAFNQLISAPESKKVGELLSLLMIQCWPKKAEEELGLLEHILTWKPFADYLVFFGRDPENFSDECKCLLTQAISLLDTIRDRISSGSIKVNTLRVIQKNKERFLELVTQSNEEIEEDDNEDEDEDDDDEVERNPVSENLQGTLDLLEMFEKELNELKSFLKISFIIRNVDVQDIKQRADIDVSEHEIQKLAVHLHYPQKRVQVIFFQISEELKEMVRKLHVVFPSEIFQNVWKENLKDAKQDIGSDKMTLERVLESIWNPTYHECRELLSSVFRDEILLKDVDHYFQSFENRYQNLQQNLSILSEACDIKVEEEDVLSQVQKIERYHRRKACIHTAKKVLEFQEKMELDIGGFEVVEELLLQMSPESKQEPLHSLRDDFPEIEERLQTLSDGIIDCLDAVMESKEFFAWLKREIPEPSEVKVLVDLAMISAGEGDMESDRIRALHTSTGAFKPIIYDLKEDHGFDELMELCDGIGRALEENPNLPEQLRDTSRDLEWIKNVKDFHGSAAMSSLMQVETILDKGTLTIGFNSNDDELDMEDVISVRFPNGTTKGLPKETYTLEDLRDLQSKLMLIAGKASGKKEVVDKFNEVLQGAITVGAVYLRLCEAGEVSHLDWKEEFPCASRTGRHNVTDVLKDTSDNLTNYLKAWIAVLEVQRMENNELNYFTAKQLLYLRKEIADLKRGRDFGSLEVQIYTLLNSVLPGVNAYQLRQALIAIDIDVDDLDPDQPPKQESTVNQIEPNLRERYKKFFENAATANFSEEVALAAIVACDCPNDESDLLMWCLLNSDKDDEIDELFNRGSRDPKFKTLFPLAHDEEQIEEAVEEMEVEQSETDNDDYEPKLDQTLGGLYLSLQELSILLRTLKNIYQGGHQPMRFPEYLNKGAPNLIFVPESDIFATIIGLYRDSNAAPTRHEVLVCTQDTSSEEIELLWRRALANKDDKFYCLANVDTLKLDESVQAKKTFDKLEKEYEHNDDYRLVLICSSEQETKSHMATAFEKHRNKGAPRCPRPNEVLKYLQRYFQAPPVATVHCGNHEIDWVPAAHVEAQIAEDSRLSVLMISSERAGTGKSLVIQDFVEQLDDLNNNKQMKELMKDWVEHVTNYIIAPLLGKTVNVSDTVGFLLPYSLKSDIPVSRIFHFDVSPSVEFGLDTVLFNLLYLGSIQDKRGRVWNRNPRDLYVIEKTSPSYRHNAGKDGDSVHHHFYDELPSIQCITPGQALEKIKRKSEVPSFNDKKFHSEAVQRVFQYLRLLSIEPELLHHFQFDPENLIDDDVEECLRLLTQHCGIRDPSWSELQYFVDFLNYQLSDLEHSVFCQMDNIGDTLEGFRLFVVIFMTVMSQDFSTRSLGEEVATVDPDETEDEDIGHFQLRRKWESSPHPYLFFNPDHSTFTFLGFRIDTDGNLIDPASSEVIVPGLMQKRLRTGLFVQRVNFEENFEDLEKAEKIAKICRVLGVEWPSDPDESYELTEDNAKKMLAIHMRFRCGIPVVIMGETGCGKTQLIRYLCGLQRGYDGPKNMLLVKVHGGTSFRDIEKKVQQAKDMAKENIKQDIETVLFFDEVNTTEAMDLVKEVMVDRRLNGRPLGEEAQGLRFIAACNPYRKHTETMIKKLESAGLGYNVKTEEIKDRIGRVPLRHLVYRVHALPESMRLMIWDFGQLKPEIEMLYTRQIVRRHVTQEGNGIPGDERLVDAITEVLAESQRFMREQKDECSFVSLRDVERTMNVLLWFYNHRNVFEPRLRNILNQEEPLQPNEPNTYQSDNEDRNDGKTELPCYFKADTESEVNETLEEDILREEEMAMPSTSGLFPGNQVDVEEETTSAFSSHRFQEFFQPKISKEPGPFVCNPQDDDDDDGDDDKVNVEEPLADINSDPEFDATKQIDPVTWSLILAIGVCYHAKLQERGQYREQVARAFRRPCTLHGGPDRILQEITRCQKAVLQELDLGPNIARNTALCENVFMMVVCIELRIPLFVIGKPGSSKSLAKTVVDANMQGAGSKSELFKSFKEVQMLAHQCSPLSKPEGITETFRQCSNLQKDKNPDRFVSVVVLDEVGLAEDSPLLPLKTLHPLLEDGVTSSDDIIETDEKPTRVAFIGISNWALDPAKMNRGIMLSRDVPGLQELEDSAMGICASKRDVQERMAHIIPALAIAYQEVYERQKNLHVLKESKKDEFFGLRDFYSLIKMIFSKAKDIHFVPGWDIVEYAVRRNFGGLQGGDLDPVEVFMKHMDVPQHHRADNDERTLMSPFELIKSSLDKNPSEEDSRYLLILTENHAALSIVQQYLKESRKKGDENDPVLIFGSNFPKDLEYTQVCRNINDIKVCMETGRTVILLNMERLYEGLYDALNQYYVHFGNAKYVDLGLGTHRVKCRVDPKFRLIVIAEKSTVYNDFPIPLINRLEKHFLVLSTSLSAPQEELVGTLKEWVERFARINTPQHHGKTREFSKGDAFVGYHEDTIPSVVLQVCSNLGQDETELEDEQMRYDWEEKVLAESKRLLVQCCTPDAIARLHSSDLKNEADDIWNMYFEQQHHSSLAEFLKGKERDEGLLIQVSTHSRLLSEDDLEEVAGALNIHRHYVEFFTLQQFQTELQFCDRVGKFFAHLGGEEGLLVVQCIPADTTFNLLACARHLLMKQRAEFTEDHTDLAPIHIIVIIQLPRIPGGYPDFVGFQGQRWESVHIDELATPSFYVPSLEDVKDQSLSELFEACMCYNDSKDNALDAVGVLRQCVQSAAQRINDSPNTVERATWRIVILLDQFSKDGKRTPVYGGNMQSFSRVLITRVHELLKERDERTTDQGKKWSTTEAMEHSDLQETGTYRRALWRKIQNAIVPILSELITYIDTNGNLELLQKDNPWLTELWLQLFQNNKFTEVQYSSFLTEENEMIRSKVPVKSSGRDGHFFKCWLPFSWLIKEKVDVMWENAKGVSENSPNHESVEECLRVLMSNSDVSAIINEINERQEAVERYIHDFVHMNYKLIEDGEVELVARAIIITTRQLHNRDGDTTDFKFPDIALVHKAYSRIEHRLACFSHLVRCKPSIVPNLLEVFSYDDIEMTLDVTALQISLESLEPQQVNMANPHQRKEWCEHVISVRAPTESMMVEEKDLENEEKTIYILTACRHLWERITAIRLLIEHVYSYKSSVNQHKVDPQNIAQLCKALDEKTDFSKAKYIEAVELFLLECIDSFTSTTKREVNEFRRRCNSFFMELISLLCFGTKDKKFTLDPDVFDIFMRYITGSSSSQTKSFSPFPDFEVDETPVVRSFLLQQLLTTRNNDGVKKYIQRYLVDARELSSDEDHVIRVCQLTADCIEDSFAAEMTERNLELKLLMAVTKKMISSYGEKLATNQDSEDLHIEVLEAISNIRHGLGLIAEWLFKSHMTDDVRFEDMAGSLNEVLSVVQDLVKRLKHRAPLVYLLKQLARRYGGPVVRELIQQPDLLWLIPRDIEGYQFMESDPDRFIAHGDIYADVRDALGDGLMSGNFDRLLSISEAHDNVLTNDVLCLMAVYREITCGYRQPRNKLPDHQELREFLELPDHLSTKGRQLATKLLDNSQGEGFSALSAQPNQPRATVDLAEVIVHTMIILHCCDDNELISTLRSLMDKPEAMKDSFLPTMPEDDFEKVRSGLTENVTWYECPAGHRYSIGDCGRANQESQCPECKSGIGGTGYQLLPGNKELAAARQDRSGRGHILGNANPNTPETGRDGLSPAAFHIIRLIMHSAMLVGSCRHPQDIAQLFTPAVAEDNLNEFVWGHLTCDLRNLAAALNRSEDEALWTVHCVLARVTDVCATNPSMFFANGALTSASNRRQWEKEFTASLIQPVLSNLDREIETCFSLEAERQQVGSDRLMREIYEIDTEQAEQLDPMHPCFWRYRGKITVEHAKQMFSEKMGSNKKSKKYKVLNNFFKEEHKLRLARYIPDIYKLQRFLIDNCSRRIDLKKAEETTIKAFQESLNDSKRKEFKAFLKSFRSAWSVVCSDLEKQRKFKLTSETCSLSISDETALSYLLPSVGNGHQSCTTAVLFYLVNAHNEFLETFYNITAGSASNVSKIPDSEITSSQILSYDSQRDLLPLIHAHCQYSLEVGQGTKVDYDWSAIQRHLIDRLIRGKSLIIFKETQFTFLNQDEAKKFGLVRNKIPQENMPATTVKLITADLCRLNDVCDVKQTLELAIGFLGSSGGDQRQSISEYLDSVLRIPRERGLRNKRAEEHCKLRHIIHLWQIVASQKAKLLQNQKEDPFRDLPECFKVPLPNNLILQLNKILKSTDVNQLCWDLVEIITLELNNEKSSYSDVSLQEYVSYFCGEENELANLEIPDEIQLKHIVNAWEIVMELQSFRY